PVGDRRRPLDWPAKRQYDPISCQPALRKAVRQPGGEPPALSGHPARAGSSRPPGGVAGDPAYVRPRGAASGGSGDTRHWHRRPQPGEDPGRGRRDRHSPPPLTAAADRSASRFPTSIPIDRWRISSYNVPTLIRTMIDVRDPSGSAGQQVSFSRTPSAAVHTQNTIALNFEFSCSTLPAPASEPKVAGNGLCPWSAPRSGCLPRPRKKSLSVPSKKSS